MDRLIAAAAWNEPQSLEQALLVAEHQKNIDWKQLDEFVLREGISGDKEVHEFYRIIARPLPD